MIRRKTLTIAAQNVKGLHNQLEHARKLTTEADITCFGETWTRPGDEGRTVWIAQQQPGPLSKQGSPGGGVVICINPLIKYKKLAEYADEWIQYIAIEIADTTIIATYLSPKTSTKKLGSILTMWNTLGNKIIIIGHLNCRRTEQDKRTTPIGVLLHKQCLKSRWNINAPDNQDASQEMEIAPQTSS